MKEINIYDSYLNRLGTIDNFQSLIWTRKYLTSGNFELHAPLTVDNFKILKVENIIGRKDSLEAGVIEGVVYKEEKNALKIICKGRFLSSYLDRRLLKKTYNFNGKVEQAMHNLINKVVAIPLLELASLKNFDEKINFQVTYKNLLNTLVKLAKGSSLGFRIVPNFITKKLLFEVYKGKDRTINQDVNNHVVFSEEYGNLLNTNLIVNTKLIKTFAVVGGEGEREERVIVEVGGGSGLELREIFVDAKSIRRDNLNLVAYQQKLRQKGEEILKKNALIESFDFQILPNANFIYKRDYDLGDIVTISKKSWNIKQNKRITEIQEVYENGGVIINLTLGNTLPEVIDWEDK